jgi:hypothetical protein
MCTSLPRPTSLGGPTVSPVLLPLSGSWPERPKDECRGSELRAVRADDAGDSPAALLLVVLLLLPLVLASAASSRIGDRWSCCTSEPRALEAPLLALESPGRGGVGCRAPELRR